MFLFYFKSFNLSGFGELWSVAKEMGRHVYITIFTVVSESPPAARTANVCQ